MAKKIDVIIKDPGKRPRHVAISNSLENLQKTVGGYIEMVTLGIAGNGVKLVVICDEDGRPKEKAMCCRIFGITFVGTIILAGVTGDEITHVPYTYQEAKAMFPQLWEDV